jgi:cephalosporin hydroxylase
MADLRVSVLPVAAKDFALETEKGTTAMQAQCTDQTLTAIASPYADAEQRQLKTGNYVYQGATVLAIFLFLISFWSC